MLPYGLLLLFVDACDATHAPRTQDIQNATTTQHIYGDTNSFPSHKHTRSVHEI